MIRNRSISFLLAVLLIVQIGIGSLLTDPAQVSAANSGPAILAKSPSSGAGNVAPNSPLIITFDENVSKGTGSAAITIRRFDNELFESYVVASDSRVSINATSRNLVTITPSKPFAVNERYYVVIDAGAFKNESNNANFNGLTSPADWNFRTVETLDTTAPVITGLNPGNGGTAVMGAPLTIQFDEPVYAASGSITVTNINQPSDSQTISTVSTNVSGNSTSTISFTLNNALKPSSTYEILISNGAFQDLSGNKFAGVSSNQWRFATSAPPLGAVSLQPADDSYNVSISSNFVLTFPVHVAAHTGNIRINNISDNSTVQTISVNSSNVTVSGGVVTINPPSDLAGKKGYYILIDPGAFKDASNGALLFEGISAANEWNFETDHGDDNTPPTLVGERRPGNIQTSPTLDLELNFSEPVYVGSGNIVIKSSNDAIVASIPVTSTKLTGGGTTKIAVKDSSVAFVNNSKYYIQIDGQAFQDARGNKFAGITGKSDWQFTVTQDTEKPAVISLSPLNNSKDAATSGLVLEALFNEQIQLGTAPTVPSVTIRRASGTDNSPITTKLAIDPQNTRKLVITPDSALAANTDYYVEITEGTVTDIAGNKFDGILNRAQWTFKTVNSTSGAPVLSKAEILGNTKIVLTYNEGLDANSVPVPANFYVTVNGAGRSVASVQVSGQTVTLTLQGTVSAGQVVKLSYSPGAKPIQDTTATAAASILNRDITNSPDTTLPRQLSGIVSGNTIILTMSEEIEQVTSNANSQFSVYLGGSYRSVTNLSSSSSTLFITFNGNAVATNETVSLSYSAGSYPVKDPAGNKLASFSSFQIQNGQDTIAPVLQSMTVLSNQITLVYNESINPALLPPTSAFSVSVNGVARGVSSVSISGTHVILNLASAVSSSDYVVVSYSIKSPAFSDFGGNPAPAFTNMTAGGSSGGSYITFSGAIAKAGTITISFSEGLNSSYVPSSSQFSVKVNNVTRPISSISINGSSVILNLYTPVAIGDTVKISYSAAGVTLRGTGGVQVNSFTDINAANQTSWTDNAGGDFEAAAGGGMSIKKSAATTVSAISPAGRSTTQYELSAEKITAAYSAIRSASGMQPRVVFTVPDSENAGMVALPLKALEDAKNATPTASVAVVYKDTTYEIPLNALDYRQLGQMMNAAAPVGQLIVSIDTNAIGMSSQLTAELNASNAQMQISPVSFELFVKSSGVTKSVDNLNGYVTRSIMTGSNLEARQIAVVWLDSQTGKLSYVPTKVTQENGKSLVTFKRKGNSVYAVVKGGVKYTDIAKHWGSNDILLMGNKYVVEGRTLTTFEPDKPVTRGEFAMFVAKGLGLSGDKQAAGKFKDVNTSTAMAAYIGAASNAGIVQGMTDGTFKPNSPVTREQMASMMVRAANAAGNQMKLSKSQSEVLKRFTDNKKIGTWAQGDVAKAVEAGIINGMAANSFGGKSNATRAQAAVMTKRLLVYLGFMDV